MYIKLPEGKNAVINLVNIFEDDKTDPIITFSDNTLDVATCSVNGQNVIFADYITRKGIDTQMPLVADYNGVYINTSIRSVDNGKVRLYAQVFKGQGYRFATRVDDYVAKFDEKVKAAGAVTPVFSCNCILNFLYGGLAGKRTPPFVGPITFGEIAYQLMNQTLVYCEIE